VTYHLKTEVDCHYKKHNFACIFPTDLGDQPFWGPNFLEAGKIQANIISLNILAVRFIYVKSKG
jgi:hypothetical protein